MLKEKDAMPSWSASDETGAERTATEFLGTWIVLYFYPKDDTPGCTKEACGFRDAWTTLGAKARILGVSADSAERHKKFQEKYKLPFTLLVDSEGKLMTLFGADGTTYPKRTTFLIDPRGTIAKIYQGMDCASHAKQIESDLDALVFA